MGRGPSCCDRANGGESSSSRQERLIQRYLRLREAAGIREAAQIAAALDDPPGREWRIHRVRPIVGSADYLGLRHDRRKR